ncbi:MAG TPA: sigma-70 family RNA polymerase sigma factor [Bryobacteraceae bacterium]|jgi:RNA polymerase sigma-70 factor (ECF subfamily)
MDSDADLQPLMVRYQQGDASAATSLVRLLGPRLHRFFLMHLVSRRHADDLLQETWMRLHQVRSSYRPGSPVLPWLYAIARNVRVDHYRKAYRQEAHEAQMDEHFEAAAPTDAGISGMEALLAELPESQREVLVMLKVCGMSLEEVARATSSSVGSVKQKAHRAYETLRKGHGGRGPQSGKVVLHEG